ASASRRKPMICSSEKRFFTSNLLLIEDWTPNRFATQSRGDVATGLRTSEMIGLCWSDIDWRKGTVKIRRAWVMGKMKAPKTESGVREVQLLQPAIDALKAQRTHTATAGEFVFHDPRTNARWGSDQSIRAGEWQRALRKAGVRYRYPYQMRHTFASQALSAGENVMWVARQMGHRDWTITAKKYGRWIPSMVPDAGAKAAAVWTLLPGKMG
ncbi:site-specific integrase, partial [Stenotrophomonas muris]